ncbi:MAG: OsmC family protein [Myxococcota bacterium]
MAQFPHVYQSSARIDPEGLVAITGPGLPKLDSAPPAEFGGPGDQWSPETLLTAAVADCFVLTFRAIARASKLSWNRLEVDVEGTLDKVDGETRFTSILVKARLQAPDGTDEGKAVRIMEKSEKMCLITNSLMAEVHLEPSVSLG